MTQVSIMLSQMILTGLKQKTTRSSGGNAWAKRFSLLEGRGLQWRSKNHDYGYYTAEVMTEKIKEITIF